MPTDLYTYIPLLPHPDTESADPQAPTHTFTFKHTGTAEASRILPVSCSYGPFRVGRVLGQGGYATAMGAQDIASNRLLCLKVFRKDRLEKKFTKEVLMNELEVYKRLSSASPSATRFIMGLEMSFQTKEQICFVMDLMAGDLHNFMRHRSAYCFRNGRRWAVQIALGLNALHETGIIHRDIKAANILIDVQENVRIADFGLCYVHTDEEPLDRQWGYTTDAVGTSYCMAPEVLHYRTNPHSMRYGVPVDWWGLGCIIYELVSKNHKSLFDKEDDVLSYVSWFSSRDRTSKRFPVFEEFHGSIGDLLSGLLNPDPSSRFGFCELVDHKAFLLRCGTSEFSDAYSRALERAELPDSLPDLKHGQDTHSAAIWFRLASWEKPRVSNVDWVRPAHFSPDL
ncbi:kinase-like domain-containing protein [Suillus americanus]|nr:kinase-like domain-containing protein [Suillus americanus]